MRVLPVSFGYHNKLKTEWKQGKLPELIHDFYDGSELKVDTISLEHLKPHSKGGRTTIGNLVLTSVQNNMKRGNADIRDYIDPEHAKRYLHEASQIKTKKINGKKYAEQIIKTLKKLGVEL